jgi:hypothetical protein
MKNGVDFIVDERFRQIEHLGYDKAHDKKHDQGELAIRAIELLATELDLSVDWVRLLWRMSGVSVRQKRRI